MELVIGLGYVGLPLAVAFAERGFPVVGIDVDGRKTDSLNHGRSYVQDIPSARLRLRKQGDVQTDTAGRNFIDYVLGRPGVFTVCDGVTTSAG